jgi:ketosteroid isomerase-like protein
MMISRYGVFAIIAVLGVACGVVTRQVTAAQAAPQTDTRAIAGVLEEQVADWNRGDIPAFMAGYWKSKDTEFENDSGLFQGWDDVLKRYETTYPNRAAMGHLTFSGLEVHVLCTDSAYVIGKYRLDRAKDHPQGVFTLIFKKFPEGWRIVNDHTTAFRVSK